MLNSPHPPLSPSTNGGSSSKILFSWLLLLRWGASVSQLVLISIVAIFFDIAIPFTILFTIIAFQLVSNLYFTHLKKLQLTIPDWLFSLVMFLDASLLTVLLYYTGGPMNPFTFIYLVHVVVGAILMKPSWTWALATFTILCYASLFFLPEHKSNLSPVAPPANSSDQIICLSMLEDAEQLAEHMKLHLWGMWVAFSITTVVIVFFIQKIQTSLEQHQATLADLEAAKIRNEKLASLATLAAGAAHEFSTPLSTIAVAAGEMLHSLKKKEGMEELIEDTQLIRDQVNRCKDILFNMAADAGEHLGESVQEFTIDELLANVLKIFSPATRNQITITNSTHNLHLMMPLRTLTRIIRGLLKNSLDASTKGQAITFDCWTDSHFLYFQVTDQGEGMEPELLERATEPFFTRKDPGKGLGLGLFLAKSAAERFGGNIKLHSAPGQGTQVTLTLELKKILKTMAKTNH